MYNPRHPSKMGSRTLRGRALSAKCFVIRQVQVASPYCPLRRTPPHMALPLIASTPVKYKKRRTLAFFDSRLICKIPTYSIRRRVWTVHRQHATKHNLVDPDGRPLMQKTQSQCSKTRLVVCSWHSQWLSSRRCTLYREYGSMRYESSATRDRL